MRSSGCVLNDYTQTDKGRDTYNTMEQKGFWSWLFRSAKDPEKLSLTIKSFFPLVLSAFVFFGWTDITESDLTEGLSAFTGIVSSIGVIIGLVRKFKKDPTLGGTLGRMGGS